MSLIKVDAKLFKAILNATAPGYRKRFVYIDAKEVVELQDLNWSGGTRSQYRGCTLDGRPTGNADKQNQVAPWDQIYGERARVPIPPGMVLVRSGHFCGKVSTATIYVNPADMPKLLGR